MLLNAGFKSIVDSGDTYLGQNYLVVAKKWGKYGLSGKTS